MDSRIGVIGIIIENREDSSRIINNILSEYGHIIKGRMGLPNVHENICAIALVVEGTNEDIGALTGKIGQVKFVKVKSTLIKKKEKKNES